MSSLKQSFLKGVKWSFIGRMTNQALRFGLTVFLARILAPDDFGLFAMITVFTSFAVLLRDAGFGQSLIHIQDATKDDYDTVFRLNILIGVFLSLLFFLTAPLISGFYNEPLLIDLTRAISVIFLIQSLTGVNNIELKKNLEFKKIAFITNTSFLVSLVVTILLALKGYGVWCLVGKSISENIVVTVLTYLYTKYRPGRNFSYSSLKKLWKYSLSLTSNKIVVYWMRNADNLMIGKFLSQKVLGEYNMGYRIMLFPIQNISHVIAEVLFPAFSKIQNDLDKIKSIYLKVVQTIALIVFPLMVIIICIPNLFVKSVLGDKWIAIASFLPLLAVVSIPQSIFTISGSIYSSIGKPQIPLKINLFSLPLYVIGFYFGIKMDGVLGLVTFYVIINSLTFIPIYYFLAKSINLNLKNYIKNLTPIVLSCLLIIMPLLFLKEQLFFLKLNNYVQISLIIILALIIYMTSIFLFKKQIHIFNNNLRIKNN